MYKITKLVSDKLLSLALLIVLSPVMFLAVVFIKFTSSGPVIYWSIRVGQYESRFRMPKFRTMCVDTPAVATHLLSDPSRWLTPVGGFMRASSIDELPQLWSIFIGDMSFVGPRPALFNQDDLIALRNKYRVNDVKPGLTGLAQVRGRDSLSIKDKVALDVEYVENQSLLNDLKILALTAAAVFFRRGISH